jgi:hypothetical protein
MTDYALMVYRLRPTSAYHITGAAGYAGIGDWRDTGTTKPTQAECDAEWIVYQAEQATAVTNKNAILALAQSAVGVQLSALTAAQIKALTACILYHVGGVDASTMTVKPLTDWLK